MVHLRLRFITYCTWLCGRNNWPNDILQELDLEEPLAFFWETQASHLYLCHYLQQVLYHLGKR